MGLLVNKGWLARDAWSRHLYSLIGMEPSLSYYHIMLEQAEDIHKYTMYNVKVRRVLPKRG